MNYTEGDVQVALSLVAEAGVPPDGDVTTHQRVSWRATWVLAQEVERMRGELAEELAVAKANAKLTAERDRLQATCAAWSEEVASLAVRIGKDKDEIERLRMELARYDALVKGG